MKSREEDREGSAMKAKDMQSGNWYCCRELTVLFKGERGDGNFLVRIDGDDDMQSMLFLMPDAEVEPATSR